MLFIYISLKYHVTLFGCFSQISLVKTLGFFSGDKSEKQVIKHLHLFSLREQLSYEWDFSDFGILANLNTIWDIFESSLVWKYCCFLWKHN